MESGSGISLSKTQGVDACCNSKVSDSNSSDDNKGNSAMPPARDESHAGTVSTAGSGVVQEPGAKYSGKAQVERRSLTLDLELRPVSPADGADQLLPLLEQLSHVGDVSPEFFKLRQDAVLKDENTVMFVIEDTRKHALVGCGTILIEPKFIHDAGCVAHLEDLVVEKGLRSKGLGSWIVNRLMDVARARGCYKMLVDCSEANVPFYEKVGFKRKGACMTLYFDAATAAVGHLRSIKVEPEGFRDEFVIRRLEPSDFTKGYLELLQQLTVVGEVQEDVFRKRIKEADQNNCFFIVIEHKEKQRVVGAGTLLVEQKFIRSTGFAGHLEDVVVDKAARGNGLGKKIINVLTELARRVGCYKCILDCDDHNVKFYERCGYSKGHSPAFLARYFD